MWGGRDKPGARHLFIIIRRGLAAVQSAVNQIVFPGRYGRIVSSAAVVAATQLLHTVILEIGDTGRGRIGIERRRGVTVTVAAAATVRVRYDDVARTEIEQGVNGGIQNGIVVRAVGRGWVVSRIRLVGHRVSQMLQPSHHVRFHGERPPPTRPGVDV